MINKEKHILRDRRGIDGKELGSEMIKKTQLLKGQ
jgi:hypothetical protein